jgi:two-component system phosphate regulon sensor histidine kinase PhoR
MSDAQRLLLSALVRVMVGAGLVAGIGALLGGATLAMALAAVVVLTAFLYHTWKLGQLLTWLRSEHHAHDMPDGLGTWGEVLSDLYRLLRQERVSQQALSDALSRFQQAAAALPDGAVMLDIDHNIVWCNPVAEDHWRISLARDRMQTITYIIRHPEFNTYLSARSINETLSLKMIQPLDNGGTRELTLAVQLVAFGDEQMLLLSRDVSERERLERMRSDFVANVSHELRTPLTVMAGFLETLQTADRAEGVTAMRPEMVRRSLDHMAQQTTRMQRLVDDLLALSRLEDQQNKLTESVIDLTALVQSSVADARVMSSGKHTIEALLDPAWLVANRDEVASVVSNLISNAVRYTPEGGQIVVTLGASAAGELVLSVADNGEGIAPEHLPRLTERFYRVDRGRSRAAGGTGLGLAIVKHVLMRHGGRLEIDSRQGMDDHGSNFRAIFPKARSRTEAPRPQAVAA